MNNIYVPSLGVSKHTELTDKDPAGVIDHADGAVTDSKLASGVGLSDGQILKLPISAQGDILFRNATDWTRLPAGIADRYLQTKGPGANPVWNPIAAVTGGFPYTLVYSATAPPMVWNDLDLSAIAGINSALVFLKIYNGSATSSSNIEVRRKGETLEHWASVTNTLGCSKGFLRELKVIYLLTTTDSSGIIQIKVEHNLPIKIYLEFFVRT